MSEIHTDNNCLEQCGDRIPLACTRLRTSYFTSDNSWHSFGAIDVMVIKFPFSYSPSRFFSTLSTLLCSSLLFSSLRMSVYVTAVLYRMEIIQWFPSLYCIIFNHIK